MRIKATASFSRTMAARTCSSTSALWSGLACAVWQRVRRFPMRSKPIAEPAKSQPRTCNKPETEDLWRSYFGIFRARACDTERTIQPLCGRALSRIPCLGVSGGPLGSNVAAKPHPMALWITAGPRMTEMTLNTASEASWQPIETAPPGQHVLLDHPAWRHPFVGQYTGVDQLVLI